jgi:hypothetical protein
VGQLIIGLWRVDYNQRRHHSSLGHLTPEEFVQQYQVSMRAEEAVCSSYELSPHGANVRSIEFPARRGLVSGEVSELTVFGGNLTAIGL